VYTNKGSEDMGPLNERGRFMVLLTDTPLGSGDSSLPPGDNDKRQTKLHYTY